MALSLKFDEKPEMVARSAAIQEVGVPPVDRGTIVGLLDRMGLKNPASGFTWETNLHWMTMEDPRTAISINKLSGGLRYRLRPLAEEPGRDVTTSAARLEEIARRFLDQLGRPDQPLVLDRITYLHMETAAPSGSLLARSTLDAGLVFTRTVDDLPIVGPGGIAMVKIGTDETVVGGREIWRPIVRRGPKLNLRTAEESIELLGRQLRASGVDGVVYVRKARLGYNELGIEEEQRYLEPCYAFVIETSGAPVDWKKVVVIPAAIGRPARLTEPAAAGPLA